MIELTLEDAIHNLEILATGEYVPYEYTPKEATLILNHINNLQSKIDKANEILDKDTNVENIYFELRDLFKEEI